MSNNDGLAERLISARNYRGLTQEQVARQAGMSTATISGYERNSSVPPYEVLKVLCHIYGVSPNFLYNWGKSKILL